MHIESDTIKNVVEKINNKYYLPALQRDFVWKPSQICALFDSLMQGYPISTFLFWDVTSQTLKKENLECYYFLKLISSKDNKPIKSTPPQSDITFVIDGQQRLTSLLVGLKGVLSGKQGELLELYLDVLHSPINDFDDDNTDEFNYKYRFEFKSSGKLI